MNKNKEAIKRINAVDGFNPEEEMISVPSEFFNPETGETETNERKYLPLNAKKVWFMLVHPQGRITHEYLVNDAKQVTVKACLYANRDDDTPFGEWCATSYYDDFTDHSFYQGKNLTERYNGVINQTIQKAIGHALYNHGFGFQLEEKDDSSQIVDDELMQKLSAPPVPPPPRKENKDSGKKKESAKSRKEAKAKEEVEETKRQVAATGDKIIEFDPKQAEKEALEAKPSVEKPVNLPDLPTKTEAPKEMTEYEKACAHKSSMKGDYETLGEIADNAPFGIVHLNKNTKDSLEKRYCQILMKEHPKVIAKIKAILEVEQLKQRSA